MLNKVKESVVYPFADPNWLKRVGYWLLYYLLSITTPALFGHYLKIVEQTATDVENETIPEFEDVWELWKRGFLSLLGVGFLQVIPALLNMLAAFYFISTHDPDQGTGPPTGFLVCFGIHALLLFLTLFLFPAFSIQVTKTKDWQSLFKLREVASITRANIGSYIVLVFFPFFSWLALALLTFTGIGVLLVIPALPLVFFAHARLTGHYYRDYVLQK